MEEPGRTQGVFENRFPSAGGNESSNRPWRQQVGNTCGTVVYSYCPAGVFFIIRAVYWFMGGKDMTGTDFTGEHLIGESRTGESHMGESRTRKFHTGKRRRIKHHTVKYDSKK